MKDWHTLAAAAAIFIVAAVLVMCVLALSGAFETENEEADVKQSSVPVSESQKPELSLGAFEGKLALFEGESKYPNEIYDVLIRSLPKADRLRLEAGITVSGEEELRKLLEDFTS